MLGVRSLALVVAAAAACTAAAQSRDPVPVETRHGTRPAPPPATAQAQPKDGAALAFLGEALEHASALIRIGELAERRAQDAAVRDYGKALVADHSRTADEIAAILGTLNVTAPPAPAPEAQSAHADLAARSGADFDAAFLALAIEAHLQALESYRAQTQANPDEQLALFAAKALPTLESHLTAATTLQSARPFVR